MTHPHPQPSANFRIARMCVLIFCLLTVGTLLVVGTVSALHTDAEAPAGHPSGPVLQLPPCTSEDGSGDVRPCMWNNPEAERSGLTLINFPDGSWCYPTESTRGVWTNCVPEK